MERATLRNSNRTQSKRAQGSFWRAITSHVTVRQVSKHSLTTYHALSQAVAPATLSSDFCSRQSHQISNISWDGVLYHCIYHPYVLEHIFERENRHRYQQNAWGYKFLQRHLYIMRTNRSCLETPTIHEEENWCHVGIHDRNYVCVITFDGNLTPLTFS